MKRRRMEPHQRMAIKFLREHKGKSGLFMACGTMKTLVAIRYASVHLPCLVICRRDDFFTWEGELSMEGVDKDKIHFIEKGKNFEPKQLICKIENRQTEWVITTYDLAKGNEGIKKLIKFIQWGTTIADESQMIRRWKSRRTKTIIKITRHIPRRIPLTGSAIGNDPSDVFSQCLFADNGKTFGQNYWKFRLKYYIQSGPGWYLKHGAKDKIVNKLKNVAFYVHEDDVLKLPPVRRLVKSAPMSGQQKRQYDKIINEWEYELGNKRVANEIDQVVTQLTKLRQVASGFLYDENHVPKWFKCYKLKLLFDLLKDPDYLGNKHKVVIWCAHTAEIDKIAEISEKQKIRSVKFSGRGRKKRDLARKMFRDDESVRLFIGQADSGVGMNELIVSDSSIYYSNSLKAISRQQSMRRNRRRGSEIHKSITYWDLVTEKTVDVDNLKALKSHLSLADYILSRVREGQRISTILSKGY
jgi:hypothetical protein